MDDGTSQYQDDARIEDAILRARAALDFDIEETRVHQILVDSGYASFEAHHAIVAAKILSKG